MLDHDNPRLPAGLDAADQEALIKYFADNYALGELAESMARNGYFDEEPLLTIPDGGGSSNLVTVEGNRRLATLKLLTNDDLRHRIVGDGWDVLASQVKKKRLTLDPVPILRYQRRRELLDFLGFRHVSGVVQWTPEAKARFVTYLITEHNYTFEDAAKAIGSKEDAIRRQFVAYLSLQQAEASGEDVSRAERSFGVYYRAVQNPAIRTYMTLKDPSKATPTKQRVIAPNGAGRVGDVISFLFGDESKRRVLRDSRQIDDLGRVLKSGTATALLKQSR